MDAALRMGLSAPEISPDFGSHRSAAVALILSGDDNELLFIRRADDPRDPWSGQIALPGGRHEQDDPTLLQTATRETQEEVGVELPLDACLGQLPAVKARSRARVDELWVTPFVFKIKGPRPETRANYEVADVLWVPVFDLVQPSRKTEVSIEYQGNNMRFPAVQLGDHKLWGLTYGIVSSLLNLLVDGAD